jgi:hypothetical protein
MSQPIEPGETLIPKADPLPPEDAYISVDVFDDVVAKLKEEARVKGIKSAFIFGIIGFVVGAIVV